jgi:hypothetical protein
LCGNVLGLADLVPCFGLELSLVTRSLLALSRLPPALRAAAPTLIDGATSEDEALVACCTWRPTERSAAALALIDVAAFVDEALAASCSGLPTAWTVAMPAPIGGAASEDDALVTPCAVVAVSSGDVHLFVHGAARELCGLSVTKPGCECWPRASC